MPLSPGQLVNSYEEESEAVMSRFFLNFDASSIPVQYGNFGLLQAGNVTITDPDDTEQYVRFNMQGGPGSSNEITRSFTEVRGLIIINIFTKRNLGSRKGRVVADSIYPIFSRVSFNGILTEAPTVVEVPPNSSWFQLNMTIPYRWSRCIS